MPTDTIPLTALVEAAKRCPDAFAMLAKRLTPQLRGMANRLSTNAADDLLQAALIRLWQKLHGADTSNGSLRSWLITVGYRAMLDEARRLWKTNRRFFTLPNHGGREEDFFEAVPVPQLTPKRYDFTGVLALYETYVEQNGAFAGAHIHVAQTLGVSKQKASELFHVAAREFTSECDAAPAEKRFTGVVRSVVRSARRRGRPLPAALHI